MTSQPVQQTIPIHILLNISRSKSYQAMKLGQLIKYKKGNILIQKSAENKVGRLVPDLFLFLKNA